MPLIFISLSETFTGKIKKYGYEAHTMRIENYIPKNMTYYVSPANSLCFMDGGIDKALSQIIFPGIEKKIKSIVETIGIKNLLGRYYLPIGSSIILNEGLIVAPTMLLPQNISTTNNAYYATMAILYNISRKENLNQIDILMTSLCCGYGKMDEDTSISQILAGIRDYKNYNPNILNENIIIKEPNLYEQPKYYQNTEWFSINSTDIINQRI
jgi:O-acetyl-ADP-ribose deacetylase (regulator of RNase III)